MPRAGALGVVTLRLLAAAVVLLVVCRPRLRGHSRADWGTVSSSASPWAAMNGLFYQAVDRIPLGPAVTLEVLGPLALSVLASRRAVNAVWAGLALGGVFLLGGGGFERPGPGRRRLRARARAPCGRRTSSSAPVPGGGSRRPTGWRWPWAWPRWCSLPLGIVESGTRLLDPTTIALGSAVAVLSSVLPYTLELLALRRLPASTFAILMSLEPAIAADRRFPHPGSGPLRLRRPLAIALVIAASMGAVRTQVGRGKAPVPEA